MGWWPLAPRPGGTGCGEATDETAVYKNNGRATRDALEAGLHRRPDAGDLLAGRDRPANPFFGSGS